MDAVEEHNKYHLRREVVAALDEGDLLAALAAIDHCARGALGKACVEVRVEGERIILLDRSGPHGPRPFGQKPRDKREAQIQAWIKAWGLQIEGVVRCCAAIDANDPKAAALHMAAAMVGLTEHERLMQESIDYCRAVAAGQKSGEKRDAKSAPMRKVARELRDKCRDKADSVNGL